MNKKIMIFVTAMVLVMAMATGATFAYLFASGNTITNTFKPTLIGAPTVAETKTDFTVTPGVAIDKDPTVKYTPDSASGTKIGTVVLYATLNLKGSTWSYASNKFTYTDASKNTLDFSINTTNWVYVGKNNSGLHVLAHVKVLSGSATSSALPVIANNKVNVSTGWTEDQLQTAFGASGVQIIVSSSVVQAKPTITGAANTAVSAANAKTLWNTFSTTANDIP